MHVESLERDLADGVALINLIEVVTGCRIRHTRNPRFRAQKIDNCEMALRAMQKELGLTVVGYNPHGTSLPFRTF
jgi:hypothetical protein